MNKNKACFILAAAILLFSSLAHAQDLTTKKYVLDDGLTVLITEMPQSTMASVYALVKTGSAMEGQYLGSGISHFVEHMSFKETRNRGVGEIAAVIQSVGGTINAATNKDYTIYTITVPKESLNTALDIIADMMINFKVSEAEFTKEREVILNEMRRHSDEPESVLSDLVYENVYLRHPYRYPVIGYQETFEALTPGDLNEYHSKRYIPNNIILSVAGNLNGEETLGKIERVFKEFKRKPEVVRNLPKEPRQLSQRKFEKEYPAQLARLSITFPGISLLDDDLYALDVLAEILGSGASSRLYQKIYQDSGLVYEISAADYTPMDAGLFEVAATLGEKNIGKTIDAVWQVINELKEKGISVAELEKIKNKLSAEFVLGRQRSSQIAYYQAVDEAYAGDYGFSSKYLGKIKSITSAQVVNAAKKYLVKDASTTVILAPEKTKNIVEKRTQISQPQIEKVILANGLTLLIREDNSLPVVSARVMINGGLRQEDENLNGISNLTASAWLKGTKTRTFKQLAEFAESRGISVDSFSGNNSFGINSEFLPQNLADALDLLEDVIKNPEFSELELDKIKLDMKAAIKERDEGIAQNGLYNLKQILFYHHPYRFDINGSEETLDKIKCADVLEFYRRLVAPANMVITIFGDINKEDIKKEIEKRFGGLKKETVALKNYSQEIYQAPSEKNISMPKEQALVIAGFPGTTLVSNDRYGIEVLSSILGSSFNGRLFTDVREKLGKAYNLGGGSAPGIDAGYIYFYILTSPDSLAQVKEILLKEIAGLAAEKVTEKELKDAKEFLKGTFEEATETSSQLSYVAGLDELLGLGFNNYKDYSAKIDSVSAEEILALSQKYLAGNKMVLVTVSPPGK